MVALKIRGAKKNLFEQILPKAEKLWIYLAGHVPRNGIPPNVLHSWASPHRAQHIVLIPRAASTARPAAPPSSASPPASQRSTRVRLRRPDYPNPFPSSLPSTPK